MNRRVSFRPEAEAEALETRDWYEGRRSGLGAEFRAALDETIERIADNPTQFRLVRGETRRAILNRFPPCTTAQTAATSSCWPCTDANIRTDGNPDGSARPCPRNGPVDQATRMGITSPHSELAYMFSVNLRNYSQLADDPKDRHDESTAENWRAAMIEKGWE